MDIVRIQFLQGCRTEVFLSFCQVGWLNLATCFIKAGKGKLRESASKVEVTISYNLDWKQHSVAFAIRYSLQASARASPRLRGGIYTRTRISRCEDFEGHLGVCLPHSHRPRIEFSFCHSLGGNSEQILWVFYTYFLIYQIEILLPTSRDGG